jgi:hypothetical protein
MRIILAGIAGGVVLFMWGAFVHTVLPIGEIGVKTLPNEAPILQAMRSNIAEPGLYFYPGLEGSHSANEAEMTAWEEKYRAGPTGIIVHYPTGREPMGATMMLTELASNILACLFVALALSWLICSVTGRVLVAGFFGIVSWLSVDASYWNWYGFPTNYFLSQSVDQVGGWLLAGVAIAWLIKTRRDEHP